MLFDLRGRGRRRVVQVVYLGLALLIGGGLILFGVGTGSGNGGLLNAFGNGSSSAQGQVLSSQEKTALKETKQNPSSPQAWADLVQARWENAGQGNNYNTNTNTFTASGRKELNNLVTDWQRYLSLTSSPSADVAVLAARAYGALGQYSNEAAAWESDTAADPGDVKGYECLAAAAYAAQQTRKAQLAEAKALSLTPSLQRATLKQEIETAKTQPTIAASC
jgi:predicted Zn-dependent protease